MLTADQMRIRLEQVRGNLYGALGLPGDTDAAVAEILELLVDVLPDLVAPATQPERPESRSRDVRPCADCGAIVPAASFLEHMQDTHGVVYAAVDVPCPDCTDTQPCARARALAGAPQELSAEYRLHRQSCTDCYKTQLCERAQELIGG